MVGQTMCREAISLPLLLLPPPHLLCRKYPSMLCQVECLEDLGVRQNIIIVAIVYVLLPSSLSLCRGTEEHSITL